MGILGDIWGGLVNTASELQGLKGEFESMSDERLMQIARTSSGKRKLAAMSVLKDRGYGAN